MEINRADFSDTLHVKMAFQTLGYLFFLLTINYNHCFCKHIELYSETLSMNYCLFLQNRYAPNFRSDYLSGSCTNIVRHSTLWVKEKPPKKVTNLLFTLFG